MKKISIVYFVKALANGGVESVLLNYFSKMNLNDYKLSIIIQGKPDKECASKFKKLGFKIYVVGGKKNLIRFAYRIHKVFKKEKPDIVHINNNYDSFIPLFLSKCFGIKRRIYHSHVSREPDNLKERLFRFLSKYVANEYMACGTDAAISLFGKKNYENGNVYILNNAVNYEKFAFSQTNRNKIRNELKIKDDEILIGNVGRLSKQKNHLFIIDFFEQCYQKNNKYKLLLVGNGELEEEINELINKKNLQNNVIILGFRDDVDQLLSAMDIFVLPSLNEGLPVAGLEASASNLPCLFADNITRECNINKNIKYLSIDDPKIWSDAIFKTDISLEKRKLNTRGNFTKNGFDIEKEALKLDKYYKK